MRILVACDHGGALLKVLVKERLQSMAGMEVIDLGTNGPESVDYPDFAQRLCRALLAGEADRGVLLCGTGLGMSMVANRFSGIRAALCHDEYTARMARRHNDANVLVIGARVIGPAVTTGILDVWLAEPFEGGRHQRRIDLFSTTLNHE